MLFKTKPEENKVKKLKQEGCDAIFSVEIPAAKVAEAFQNAIVQVQGQARMPGFRTGKMPLELVKKNFPEAVRERALDNAVRESLMPALETEKVLPVVPPVIKKLEFEEGKPLKAEVEVELAPEFDAKNYTGAQVKCKKAGVSDAQVEEAVNELRNHNARLEPASEDAATAGHFVIVDYEARDEKGVPLPDQSAKGELVDMSSPQTLPGLVQALTGAKKGDVREFAAVNTTGAAIQCKATVTDLKKKILPEFNDEFAKQLGLQTAAELKEQIRKNLERDHSVQREREILRQIENHLVSGNQIPLPKTLVERHVELSADRLLERLDPDVRGKLGEKDRTQLLERLRPAVEHDLRVGYIIRAVARQEKLNATEADFEAEVEKMLAHARNDKEKKQARKYFEARREEVLAGLTERKVMDFLKTGAKLQEE
ncbi:MAG TPA: trigger factor [Elusimicrobiales bacterium]|nr:trigger factor [Elusimicrobiales bacterium]